MLYGTQIEVHLPSHDRKEVVDWPILQHRRVAVTGRRHAWQRGPNIFRGPGIENWDLSLIKNITLYERLHIQLRVATFNTFNHTQFTTVNTSATFNPATGAQTNSKLGAFTAAGDPRQMQLGIRLVY